MILVHMRRPFDVLKNAIVLLIDDEENSAAAVALPLRLPLPLPLPLPVPPANADVDDDVDDDDSDTDEPDDEPPQYVEKKGQRKQKGRQGNKGKKARLYQAGGDEDTENFLYRNLPGGHPHKLSPWSLEEIEHFKVVLRTHYRQLGLAFTNGPYASRLSMPELLPKASQKSEPSVKAIPEKILIYDRDCLSQ